MNKITELKKIIAMMPIWYNLIFPLFLFVTVYAIERIVPGGKNDLVFLLCTIIEIIGVCWYMGFIIVWARRIIKINILKAKKLKK